MQQSKIIFLLISLSAFFNAPASATMPPNPERLVQVSTCSGAKENLLKAKRGSPLISRQKNAKIVSDLEKAVKRFCRK